MIQKIVYLFMFCLLPSMVCAHSLQLEQFDNGDATLTVTGGFSTGQTAEGATIKIESLATGNILFQQRLPEESEVTIAFPQEPYLVTLEGGPGHTVTQEGIPPEDGFTVEPAMSPSPVTAKPQPAPAQSSSYLQDYALGITFMFIILTLYFSHRNTQKLLAALKDEDTA